MSEPGTSGQYEDEPQRFRKVKVHKIKPAAKLAQSKPVDEGTHNANIDRKIAELIPGLADLSVSDSAMAGAVSTAGQIRKLKLNREETHRKELVEMQSIYSMDQPNPVDNKVPEEPWKQTFRPTPKKIVVSPYQYEMINYQRMLLRKNIWYYRDRMNVPRGPCPLHVLKEAWVQGVIDENTLVWGQGLFDWLPAKNVKLLLPMVRTPEVRFGAWFKRTFSLKPSLNRIREQRKESRDPAKLSKQVEVMR